MSGSVASRMARGARWERWAAIALLAPLPLAGCGGEPAGKAPVASGAWQGLDRIEYRVEPGAWWRLPVRCRLTPFAKGKIAEGEVAPAEVRFRPSPSPPWIDLQVARTAIVERSFPVWLYGGKVVAYWQDGKGPEQVGVWTREEVLESIRRARGAARRYGEMAELEEGDETVLEARVEIEMRLSEEASRGAFELLFETGPPLVETFRLRVRRRGPKSFLVEAPLGAPCGRASL